MARIGLLPLARETFDVAYAEQRCRALRELLAEGGHETIGGETLLLASGSTEAALERLQGEALDMLLVAQVTFTDATMTVRIAETNLAPLAFWSFPEPRSGGRLRLNAFCGLNLAAHALGLGGHRFGWVHMDPENSEAAGALDGLIAGRRQASPADIGAPQAEDADRAAARKALDAVSGARIGRIGERPDGFFTCDYNPARLSELAGVSVEKIALESLFAAACGEPEATVSQARAEAAATLPDLDIVDQDQLDRSLRLRAALETLRQSGGFDAFAVRCWPEMFTVYGGAICGPAGMMGERRVPCACEADVHGALTNLFLQNIAGEPAFLVDLVDLDAADDTGVVWHCGQAPVSMRDTEVDAHATIHSNRRMPLLFEFPLKPGRVTLARLSQAHGRLAVAICGAEAIRRPPAFSGTAGVLRFDGGAVSVGRAIIGSGVEHHLSLVYGDHRAVLRGLAAEMALPVIEI